MKRPALSLSGRHYQSCIEVAKIADRSHRNEANSAGIIANELRVSLGILNDGCDINVEVCY